MDDDLPVFEEALPDDQVDDYRTFRRERERDGYSVPEINAEYAGRTGLPFVGKHPEERDRYKQGVASNLPMAGLQ